MSTQNVVPNEEATRKAVQKLIIELAPNTSFGTYSRELKLADDLHYNSLALMELAFTLEDEFGLSPISEEQAKMIVTAGDIEDHVVREMNRNQSPTV